MLQDLVDVYEIKSVIRVIESVYISHSEFYICDPPLGSDLTSFRKYIFFCIDADDLTLRSKLGKVGGNCNNNKYNSKLEDFFNTFKVEESDIKKP